MKIFFDHQIFSIQAYGGLSRYIYELLIRLLKYDGNRISLFAGFSLNRFGIEEFNSEFEKFWSKVYSEIPKTKMIVFDINSFLMKNFIRNINPEIYHQTYYAPLLEKFKGYRVVTMLDMTHELFPESFSKYDKTVEWKKKSIELADAIICISQSTKNDLIEMYGYDESKIQVIYLGNSISKPGSKLQVEKPFILFVGARRGYKNFEVLFNVYKNSPGLKNDFDLICFGGGSFSETELKKINEASLQNKVIYESGDDQKLAMYYDAAAVFVYPSKYEGFGIPPLEAMSIGCPVIAGNKSSVPEVVGDGGILFNPDSEEELSVELGNVLYNESFRQEIILKGFDQSKKFSWDKCAEETQQFYKKIK